MTARITEPGVYELDENEYHADPVVGGSLSVSGAKRLLPPSCPAIFAWERAHGRPDTHAFDFGHAAHKKVLGVGNEVVILQRTAKDGAKSDATDRRAKSTQEHEDEIRAAGNVPLLASEAARVDAMAAKIQDHPIARTLLNPEFGKPEQSLFWPDLETGVWRRSRLDWLPTPSNGQVIVADYKTSESANPAVFERSHLAQHGYDMQAAWYVDAVVEVGVAEAAEFVFIIQQKTPPFLVTIAQPDIVAMKTGRERNRRAIDIYAKCAAAGEWPGFGDEVALVTVPFWHVRATEEEQ